MVMNNNVNLDYIETQRIIQKNIVNSNEVLINYLYAGIIYNEYINALKELIEFETKFMAEQGNDLRLQLYNSCPNKNILDPKLVDYVEMAMVKYYVLYSRTLNLACDACESYAKAILVENGIPLKKLNSFFGHNLFDLYNEFEINFNGNFNNITEQEKINLKSISGKSTNDQAGIRARYPGQFLVTENGDIVFKLLEDVRQVSFLCGNNEDNYILNKTYHKNENFKITKQILNKYQDNINFLNAELMTEELLDILNEFNYNYIFATKKKDLNEKINIYILRAIILKKSCDVFEHCGIYLTHTQGKNWEDTYRIKHNLGKMFNLIEPLSRMSIVLDSFFTLDSLEEQAIFSEALINSDEREVNMILNELMDERFVGNIGVCKFNKKQMKNLIVNEETREDFNILNIYQTLDLIFKCDATGNLNHEARFPGTNYIHYNGPVVLNLALGIANEALVINSIEKKIKTKK